MKLNHAKRKREVAAMLYNEAMKNTERNCIANFERPIRDLAWKEAEKALKEGYVFSKTQYAFFSEPAATRDIFLTATSKLWIENGMI